MVQLVSLVNSYSNGISPVSISADKIISTGELNTIPSGSPTIKITKLSLINPKLSKIGCISAFCTNLNEMSFFSVTAPAGTFKVIPVGKEYSPPLGEIVTVFGSVLLIGFLQQLYKMKNSKNASNKE